VRGTFEKWFVDCKRHKRGVPPEKIQGLLAWAHADRPHVALIIASNFLSNPTKDYLRDYEQNNRPPFRIKFWERPTLERITRGRDDFLTRHLLGRMRTESEILAAESEFFNRVWYRRHQTLMRVHEARDHDHKTVTTGPRFDLTEVEAREILGRSTRKGLEIAVSEARWVEELYGTDTLGPYSDVEWGMILGKLSAAAGDRWPLGRLDLLAGEQSAPAHDHLDAVGDNHRHRAEHVVDLESGLGAREPPGWRVCQPHPESAICRPPLLRGDGVVGTG
jgi:Restriction endonuclease